MSTDKLVVNISDTLRDMGLNVVRDFNAGTVRVYKDNQEVLILKGPQIQLSPEEIIKVITKELTKK